MKMKRVGGIVGVVCLAAAAAAAQDPPVFQPAPLTAPAEYEITVAAAPPLVKHPLMAGFDPQGRLYIAESAGQNLRRPELEKELPNFVRRLEDVDGDGVFDRSTIFADGLTLPQGALWHDGAVYVAAPPSIWKFVDTDDDGVADQREELVDNFGYTGNAASIHGCFLGPTGRLYWCDGRHGHEVRDPNGQLISEGKAARIFSCLPDGSDFRVDCGGGMDNPVEVDFMPTGEMLGTVNIFYRQRGDCLVHWMHGGVYPRFDQKCVEEFPRTGDLLREVHNLGHVAVSGMTRLRSADGIAAGKGPNETQWLLTEFNSHKIMQASLKRKGSTFVAEVRELMKSSSPDFHPTDVLEDADGSVLVIDTGGWFRIGCPTSQIAKPNILGAIYRIRRRAQTPGVDPRGQQLKWDVDANELVERLADPRPAVVERATAALSRGDAAAKALAQWNPMQSAARLDRIWALARNRTKLAEVEITKALESEQEHVPLVAAKSAGELRINAAVPQLVELLQHKQLAVRREAATALGRIGDKTCVEPLLKALESPENDRLVVHALIYAMMEINDGDAIVPGLSRKSDAARTGALIALDQMKWEGLEPTHVTSLLDTSDFGLRAAALEAISRRPEWSLVALRELETLLSRKSLQPFERRAARSLLFALASHDQLPPLVARMAGRLAPAELMMVLEFMASQPVMPASWAEVTRTAIQSQTPDVSHAALDAVVAHPQSIYVDQLAKIGRDESLPVSLRIAGWQAWTACVKKPLDADALTFLGEQLREHQDPLVKVAAARAVGQSSTTLAQANEVADWARAAGPLELPALSSAWQGHNDQALGRRVVAALQTAPGASALSLSALESIIEPFPVSVRKAGEALLVERRAAVAQQAEKLAEYVAAPDGNAMRGKEVFFSRGAGCAACHRVGKLGGNVGPDLTAISQRRSKRDLLEAVLFPSASQARGFESYLLRLDDGRQLSGLILSETGDTLRIRTTDQREVQVPRAAIEAMKPSEVSVMPAGLQQTMTDGQLRDLVAYLRSL